MKMYRTTGILTINSGEIKLDEKQAGPRRHLLIPTETEGVYLPKGVLQFKVGEVIGLPAINKAQMMVLEPLEILDPGVYPGIPKGKGGRPKGSPAR